MELSDEDLNALVEKLAPKLAPQQESKPEPDNKSLAEQIANIMEEKSTKAKTEVYETLWQDKLDSMFNHTQGFKEFMEDEDDYGKVRIDRLKEMPFEERVKTVQKLEQQYRKAVSNGTTKAPAVSAKTQELAESNEKQYNEVEKKLNSNQYGSVDELQAEFFDALSNEIDSVIGN